MLELIAFDADDTLWHNESHFACAQEKFKEMMHEYLGETYDDRHLYETEIRNLKHYGYGVKSFGLSMIESAIELTGGKISSKDLQSLVELTKDMIQAPIEVLPHVESTLSRLASDYAMIVITKGDLFDQENKAVRSGLADYFHDIEVVSLKDPHTYRKILYKYGIRSRNFMMVGNSLRSDILPVVEIGAKAVHIPYHRTWEHEHIELSDQQRKSFIAIESMAQLPELLVAAEVAA